MHLLTIVFGPSPTPFALLFRTSEAAEMVQGRINDKEEILSAIDDFGQFIWVRKNQIHGIMLEDMDLSKMAHVEQGLHRARTQAKAQEMAQVDPVLKVAAMRQGPSVLQPGFGGPGNGAFRGQ